MSQTEGERIAVLENQVERQDREMCELKVDVIERMDRGFADIKELISKMVISYDKRFEDIDRRIEERIKESDKNQRELSDRITRLKDEIMSVKGTFKGVCIVLSIIWTLITFIVPLVK